MSDAILELARTRLQKVKKSGPENIMAICPFHRKSDGSEEHNGSFSMNKYNGLWYCHSCRCIGCFSFNLWFGWHWYLLGYWCAFVFIG